MLLFHLPIDSFFITLLGGLILDALFGDPEYLPHPIRLFGRMIALAEKRYNKGKYRKVKGVVVASTLVVLVFEILYAFQWVLVEYIWSLTILNTILFYFAIANRSLIDEAVAVDRKSVV